HAWAMTLVAGTAVLTLAVYVLQRSFVLTTRGPRLAGGARTHLLLLGAALLALKAVGFWLDRYEVVFSPRGIVFGASYTDVHASLPMLGALAQLSTRTSVACGAPIKPPRRRRLAGAGAALLVVWVLGLGVYPA